MAMGAQHGYCRMPRTYCAFGAGTFLLFLLSLCLCGCGREQAARVTPDKENPSPPEQVEVTDKQPAPVEFVTRERVLCTIDWSRCIKESLTASPDGAHLAWVEEGEKGQRVVVDGEPGKWFDEIADKEDVRYNPCIFFSPDSQHIAYRGKRGEKVRLVLDGVEGKEYDGISDPEFSPDSTHIAYGAGSFRKGTAIGKGCVVLDGRQGEWYDQILWVSPPARGFSSAHVARQALRRVLFSPDGGRRAYIARRGFEQVVVVDGVEQKHRFHHIWRGTLMFSEDGSEIGYVGSKHPDPDRWDQPREMEHFLVVNGEVKQKYPPFGDIIDSQAEIPPGGSIYLSPDLQRVVFAIHQAVPGAFGYYVVSDGDKRGLFSSVEGVIFTADGKHIAYRAKKRTAAYDRVSGGEADVVVFDGQEGPEFSRIDSSWFVFSPDGRHLAYTGYRRDAASPRRSERSYLVVDGKEFPVDERPYGQPFATAPIFSPDSSRVAYSPSCLYALGENYGDVTPLGPMKKREYSKIIRWSLTFSDDGKHYAYTAKRGLALEDIPPAVMVILDGEEGKVYSDILGGPVFVGSRRVRYLALEGPDKVLVVEQEVKDEG